MLIDYVRADKGEVTTNAEYEYFNQMARLIPLTVPLLFFWVSKKIYRMNI